MGLTGDRAGIKRLGRSVQSLAHGEEQSNMLGAIRGEVRALLKDEFTRSVGADGSALQETVRGRPALVSKKLAGAFTSRIDRGSLRFVGKSKRDLLTAHQFGATFAERKVAALKQHLTFDKNGRLIKAKRALNKKGEARRGTHQTFARAHTVGQRVLPARPIVPEDTLPERYETAIAKGVAGSLDRWGEKASR
jgi:hypothetical protein